MRHVTLAAVSVHIGNLRHKNKNIKKYFAYPHNTFCIFHKAFSITLKERFPGPKFHFWLKVHKLDDSFTFICKKILCHIYLCFYAVFLVWILWPDLRIYSKGGRFFDKFENIIHELRWSANFNFQISTLYKFWY